MSTPQPSDPPTATAETPDEEAELYAASAAENALPTDKSVSEPSQDVSALSESLNAAVLEESPSPAEDVAAPGDKAVETAEEIPALTKEEMVEEALQCPCIAAMRDGPCGESFISAYRCFLESETEPKGMNCMDQFSSMQTCMSEHPEAYPADEEGDPFSAADGKKETNAVDQSESERPVAVEVKTSDPQTAKAAS